MRLKQTECYPNGYQNTFTLINILPVCNRPKDYGLLTQHQLENVQLDQTNFEQQYLRRLNPRQCSIQALIHNLGSIENVHCMHTKMPWPCKTKSSFQLDAVVKLFIFQIHINMKVGFLRGIHDQIQYIHCNSLNKCVIRTSCIHVSCSITSCPSCGQGYQTVIWFQVFWMKCLSKRLHKYLLVVRDHK